MVIGLGLLFLNATERHFVELDRATLLDKRRSIEEIVRDAPSADAIAALLAIALDHHGGLAASVVDAHGKVLYRSASFRSELLNDIASGTLEPDAESLRRWQVDAHELRGFRFQASTDDAANGPLEIVLALETGRHEHFLSGLRGTLVAYTLLAVAASGLVGWLAAHHGLAPLRSMRSRAAAVSGHALDARMPADALPREIADLARALNAMLDRLQDDHRRLAEFSSDLAHELRTPISNLLTQTQVALSARRDVPTYVSILASNSEELERMGRLVTDLLFLAKAERGASVLRCERFPAAPEVVALLEFYDALAEDRDLRLRADGDVEINGDRAMFRRAVSNLLSNAVRHADPGSEVVVLIEADAHEARIAVENVADNLEAEVLPRLFDRFYRADPARRHPASEGAGLGLSITKAIVEAHAGRVEAHSAGRRVRFTMCFPTDDGSPRVSTDTAAAGAT